METVFRKYFWVLQILVLAIAALLMGAGVARLLLTRAAPFSVSFPDTPPEPTEDDDPSIAENGLLTPELLPPVLPPEPVDRCADVTCEEGEVCDPASGICQPDAPVAEQEDGDAMRDGGPCVDTTVPIELVGTMVSEVPEWSVAILHNPATNKTEFARLETSILNQAEVVSIARNRVMLDRAGDIECLRPAAIRDAARAAQAENGGAANNRRNNTTRRSASARRRAASPDNADDDAGADNSAGGSDDNGVRRLGDNSYEIDREALNNVLSDQSTLRAQAPQVTPHYRDGRPNGFRLSGVDPNSMFASIGVQNGDVIHSVNGQVIDSPQRAMQLYQSLTNSSGVSIVVERRGRQETLNYQIR